MTGLRQSIALTVSVTTLLMSLTLSPGSAAAFDQNEALAISQAAISNRVSNIELIDSAGQTHYLHDLIDRPMGISLIYSACAHACSVTTRYLDRVVKTARLALDADSFGMLSIGFEFGVDSPESMHNYARRHGVDDEHWRFVVAADKDELNRLIEELGFVYFPSPRGFDHTVQLSLLDRDGRVYRQVYGETFDAPQLVEPLKDLVWRRADTSTTLIGSISNRIRLICTVYDARGDRYYFNYSLFMGLIFGGIFILGIAAWTLREILRRQRVNE